LREDPAAAAPPIPWEQPDVSFPRRLFGTLGSALKPTVSAPAFGGDRVGPALRFALLVAVPLALLRGVIPLTETLRFGGFSVELVGAPSGAAIVLDIARAMGLSLAISLVVWLALTLPFVTLARSYGTTEDASSAAWRASLYRAWLVPFSSQPWQVPGLLLGLVVAGATERSNPFVLATIGLLDHMVPLLLLLLTLRATARFVADVRPVASYLIVGVSLTMYLVAGNLLMSVAEPLLPDLPAAEEEARDGLHDGPRDATRDTE
jgi:hypothetical protein